MDKKFELVKENTRISYDINNKEITLYQIRALKDFTCPFKLSPDTGILDETFITKGTLGGWVQKEENLSQENGCWIFKEAIVRDNARVEGNARVVGRSLVKDNAVVKGYSCLKDGSYVYDNAVLDGCTNMKGQVSIGGNSKTNGFVCIHGNSQVHGDSILDGDIYLNGTIVVDNAKITGVLHLCGQYRVAFNVDGDKGVAAYRTTELIHKLHDHDEILNTSEYIISSTKEDIWVVKEFSGTGEEFIRYVEEKYPPSRDYYRNLVEFHKKQYNL